MESKFFCMMERAVTPDDGGGTEAEPEPAEEQITHLGGKVAQLGRERPPGRSRARAPSKPRATS